MFRARRSKILGWPVAAMANYEPGDRAVWVRLLFGEALTSEDGSVFVSQHQLDWYRLKYRREHAVETLAARGWLAREGQVRHGRRYLLTEAGYAVACRIMRDAIMAESMVDEAIVAQALNVISAVELGLLLVVNQQPGGVLDCRGLDVRLRKAQMAAEAALIREGLVRRWRHSTKLKITPAGRWLCRLVRQRVTA